MNLSNIYYTSLKSGYKGLRKLWSLNIFTLDEFDRVFYKHGYKKIWNGVNFMYEGGNGYKVMGLSNKGKKRPEHATLMKIKGFIRGKSGKINEDKKIKAAVKYCEENNIKYIYLKHPLKDLKNLENGN